jgi:rubrerythrin
VKQIDEALQVIEKLSENENALGKLYDAYAEAFPDLSPLWKGLAEEERGHGKALLELKTSISHGQAWVYTGRIRLQAISTTIQYILKELEKAEAKAVDRTHAFSVARDVEQSLLEKKLFVALKGDSPPVRKILSWLSEETQKHCERIAAAQAKL